MIYDRQTDGRIGYLDCAQGANIYTYIPYLYIDLLICLFWFHHSLFYSLSI
jgi:hypothetical protein